METWGVLVWNMASASPGRHSSEANMTYLSKLVREHSIKVALLNEANVFYLGPTNAAAIREGLSGPFAFSEEGTKGRDSWTDKEGVRKSYDRHTWSAAVLSPMGPRPIGEREVRAVSASRDHPRRPDIPFTSSRPGTWIAATVLVGNERVSCVSLYGLMEELSDASMHTSLSEISPIFSDPDYKHLVLLGGDFNTFASGGPNPDGDRIVLERIEAYGLRNCLAEWRQKHEEQGCTCEDGLSKHRLTRLAPNEAGKDIPWQQRGQFEIDYLFASEALADRVENVIDIPVEEWEQYSDHRPIIVTFRTE